MLRFMGDGDQWAMRRAGESEPRPRSGSTSGITSGPTSGPTSAPMRSPTRAPMTGPTRVDFPVFSPSRTPMNAPTKRPTKSEGINRSAKEVSSQVVEVHLFCFHLFCSWANQKKFTKKSPPFFNAKSSGKCEEIIHKSFLESEQSKNAYRKEITIFEIFSGLLLETPFPRAPGSYLSPKNTDISPAFFALQFTW